MELAPLGVQADPLHDFVQAVVEGVLLMRLRSSGRFDNR
jgi:hypothetical protein